MAKLIDTDTQSRSKKDARALELFTKKIFAITLFFFIFLTGSAKAVNASPSLLYSTYFGGGSGDEIYDVAVDGVGNIYVTGGTGSASFPKLNAFQQNQGGNGDAFVSKFSPQGNLIYSTYLGGSSSDYAQGIAVDPDGNAYVTGVTKSVNFPTLNAYDVSGGGTYYDTFISKFAPNGVLVYSTYLGGSGGNDFASRIAIDEFGSAYIVGYTDSSNFPTINAYDSTLSGNVDAFVTKFSPDGQSLVYSTYLGGNSGDNGYGITVDGSGNAYVTGSTSSNDFPLNNAYQTVLRGNSDAFVTKFSPDGQSLVYSTFLGGNNSIYGTWDEGFSIALDSSGNAYVTGRTTSSSFPITTGTLDTIYNTGDDAFITKLSPDGHNLVYSTYLGGVGNDDARSIVVDDNNHAFVVGTTESSNFPVNNAFQTTPGSYRDSFVAELSETGSSLVYSSYLGGSDWDYGYGIAIDGFGDVYVAGNTYSPNFPTVNAYQNNLAGSIGWNDGFLSKIGYRNEAPIANAGIDQTVIEGQQVVFDGSASTDPDGVNDIVNYNWDFGDGATASGITVNHSYADNGIYAATLTVTDTANHTSTDLAQITVNNVAPVVGIVSPISSVLPGVSVSTSADFTDVGILDIHISSFDWGDGMVTQGEIAEFDGSGSVTGSHTYSSSGVYVVTLTITDKDGAFASNSTNVTILTSTQATENLTSLVQTYNLQQGIENSLDAKLDAAMNTLNDLNSNNDSSAINSLQAFINAVEAQRGNKITNDQADILIQKAQEIINQLL